MANPYAKELQATAVEEIAELRRRLAALKATRPMRQIIAGIYRTAGFAHALATIKGWTREEIT